MPLTLRRRTLVTVVVLLIASAPTLAARAAAVPVAYTVQAIAPADPFPTASQIDSTDGIDADGDVLLQLSIPSGQVGYLLHRDGSGVALRCTDGTLSDSSELHMNERGAVSGICVPADGPLHGVVWDATGDRTELHGLGAGLSLDGAEPLVITDRGDVYGWVLSPDGTRNISVEWPAAQQFAARVAPRLGGSLFASINNRGYASYSVDLNAALITPSGRIKLLQRLPGSTDSEITAISNRNVTLGYSSTADGRQTPVVWNRSGDVTPLATVPGAVQVSAKAINRDGVVVGTAYYPDGSFVGVVWASPRTVSVLPAPTGSDGSLTPYYYVNAINDRGVIGGWSERVIAAEGPFPSFDEAVEWTPGG